jgi:hypothetical protein
VEIADAAELIGAELDRTGLLLWHDRALPSVTALLETRISGTRPFASWRSGPLAEFVRLAVDTAGLNRASLKLVSGKDTLVAPRLFPELAAIGWAGDSWQLDGLSASARSLLDAVEETDGPVLVSQKELRPLARELERRLLVHVAEVRVPDGEPHSSLWAWSSWAGEVGIRPPFPDPRDATDLFDEIVSDWGPPAKRASLPWHGRN